MPKGFLLTFLILLFLGESFAGSVYDFPLNAENRPVLEKSFSILAAHKVTRGNFKQTKTITRISRTFISEGTFVIADGNGIIWDTQKPFPSTLVITSDKIVQKTPQGKNSTLDASDNAAFREFSNTIQAVFSGKPSELYSQFNIFFSVQGNQWKLGLIPKEDVVRSMVSSIELHGDFTLNSVLIKDGNQDLTQYEFSAHKYSEDLEPKEKDVFGRP